MLDDGRGSCWAYDMSARTPRESLYEHAGGEAALHRLAESGDELHPLREVPRWTWAGDACEE